MCKSWENKKPMQRNSEIIESHQVPPTQKNTHSKILKWALNVYTCTEMANTSPVAKAFSTHFTVLWNKATHSPENPFSSGALGKWNVWKWTLWNFHCVWLGTHPFDFMANAFSNMHLEYNLIYCKCNANRIWHEERAYNWESSRRMEMYTRSGNWANFAHISVNLFVAVIFQLKYFARRKFES